MGTCVEFHVNAQSQRPEGSFCSSLWLALVVIPRTLCLGVALPCCRPCPFPATAWARRGQLLEGLQVTGCSGALWTKSVLRAGTFPLSPSGLVFVGFFLRRMFSRAYRYPLEINITECIDPAEAPSFTRFFSRQMGSMTAHYRKEKLASFTRIGVYEFISFLLMTSILFPDEGDGITRLCDSHVHSNFTQMETNPCPPGSWPPFTCVGRISFFAY